MSKKLRQRYTDASVKTANNLKSIAQSFKDLSRLSLPEIEAVVEQVARIVPAGNVPGVILNGLARLSGRRLPLGTIKRDMDLLFRGVEQTLDKATFGVFFAGPAAIIWAYQHLLNLAGKRPEDAFPDGTWQFYVDYALREDTARHANETYGFDATLKQHQLQLEPVDRITALTMTAIHTLHQFDDLLAVEWRERVCTHLLRELTQAEEYGPQYARLYQEWAKQRPYKRRKDAGTNQTYPAYRRQKFDQFLADALQSLPAQVRTEWTGQVQRAEAEDLPAYQQQLSILAYLDPGTYGETRTPIPLSQAHIGLIFQGHYYLIPICNPKTETPSGVNTVRQQVATILATPVKADPPHLVNLAGLKRTALTKLLLQLDETQRKHLETLRLTPILINCDQRPRGLPLAELRQAERGFGDHALTLFDTGETLVFDQSHIFFDGGWGAALAEIMTNDVLSWAVHLNSLPPAQPGGTRPYALAGQFQEAENDLIAQAPKVTPEVAAESDQIDLKAIQSLRKMFKQRSNQIRLTVNDLLVLYRAIHALTYQPDPDLKQALETLAEDSAGQKAARMALGALADQNRTNPAIVIPVDASPRSPRERLYPMTFEVPLEELNFLTLFQQTNEALQAYKNVTSGTRTQLYAQFDQSQRELLATLAGFGAVMGKAKEIALVGESASVGSIKLLAHMPPALQRMLDHIPSSIEILNDIIKGKEVFSNVGAVVPSSTLTRFITAKDDNEQKSLAWGVMTDAKGVMRLSLRDFRPHVGLLLACGQPELAKRLAQDYVDAYASGLNAFVTDLRRITSASRDSQPNAPSATE